MAAREHHNSIMATAAEARGARKRKWDIQVHRVVDALGYLLALPVTPANNQDRAQMVQKIKQG